MTEPSVTLVWPTQKLININAERSMHYQTRSRRVHAIREATAQAAADVHAVATPVSIRAHMQWADSRVRDSSNWFPTIKAMVDGLVDAGVLPADDDRWVRHTGMGVTLPPQRGLKGYVRIELALEAVAP